MNEREYIFEKVANAYEHLSAAGLDPVSALGFAEAFSDAPNDYLRDKVAAEWGDHDYSDEHIEKIAEVKEYLSDIGYDGTHSEMLYDYAKEAGMMSAIKGGINKVKGVFSGNKPVTPTVKPVTPAPTSAMGQAKVTTPNPQLQLPSPTPQLQLPPPKVPPKVPPETPPKVEVPPKVPPETPPKTEVPPKVETPVATENNGEGFMQKAKVMGNRFIDNLTGSAEQKVKDASEAYNKKHKWGIFDSAQVKKTKGDFATKLDSANTAKWVTRGGVGLAGAGGVGLAMGGSSNNQNQG